VVWWRRLAWGVAGLVGLWIVAWLAVPPIARWQAQLRLSELLGRPVTIGEVGFEPWRLALTVTDLRIGPAAGASAPEPLLQVQRIRLDVDLASLWHRAPVLESLEIDAPRLRLARTGEGRYDIDDLIERFSPPSPTPASAEPARFALYNLQLREGALRFDDRPVGRVHQVAALTLSLPFLSNLPSEVAIKVQPRLGFTLDGTRFDSGAQATPFAQTREADLQLRLAPLRLEPYLGYLPAELPVKLQQGSVAADLTLQFRQGSGRPEVALKGWASASGIALADRAQAPLLSWRELRVDLREVRPLDRQVALAGVRLDGARLKVVRAANGRLNLQDLVGTEPRRPEAVGPTTSAGGWRLALDQLELTDAGVDVDDAGVKPRSAWQLAQLGLQIQQLRWPDPTPAPLTLAGQVRQGAAEGSPVASLQASGTATDRQARIDWQLQGLQLEPLAPYLAAVLTPRLSGQVQATGQVHWSAASAEAPAALKIALQQVSADALRLTEGAGKARRTLAGWQQFAGDGIEVDVPAKRVAIAGLRLTQPELHLERDRHGQWNALAWAAVPPTPASAAALTPVSPPAAPSAARAPATEASGRAVAAKPEAGGWSVALKDFTLQGGRLDVTDAAAHAEAGEQPARMAIGALRVRLQDLAWPARGRGLPARLSLGAQVGLPQAPGSKPGAPPADAGTLEWTGRLGLSPLQVQGQLRLDRLPLHVAEPWARTLLPVQVQHAEVGWQGPLTARQEAGGWEVQSNADVRLSAWRLATRARGDNAGGDELLSWQNLAVDGLAVTLEPGQPLRVETRGATLQDFYSRLVVTEQGRFNLLEAAAPAAAASSAAPLVAASAPAGPVASATSGPVASAAAGQGTSAGAGQGTSPAAGQDASPSVPAASTPTPAGPALQLAIGPTRLVNGRIDFSDRFVRPNYSSRLTELNGQLGAFRSGTREMAALELRGRAEGTALLEIIGQLNPTADPLALDIRAKATDLELAPLSPYAGKYAGYAIERGKLSMDVAYRIEPDGKLDAKNQVILNQLTFGEKVASPDATKLPVLLAVALLKDRHGVIDINLPISGSLKDPQFSVGGIIVKIIVNLLTKAFTAPFALLAGGGTEDLSHVAFEPGTARMTDAGRQALDKVGRALLDRPALTMTVTGAADPASERKAWQVAMLESRLQAERRRELGRSLATPATSPVPVTVASSPGAAHGASAAQAVADEATVALSPADRARLLKQVYQQTSLPNKPRNVLGLAKDLPPAEMQALLEAAQVMSTDTARDLALQRGIAVRDALVAKGLPVARLFLAAPKLRASGEDDAAWSPRVQLSLAAP